jgi:hypothetical protein
MVQKLALKFGPMNNDHLHNRPQKTRADMLWSFNLQKGNKAASVMVIPGVSSSSPYIQQTMNCQKFIDDPILLSAPDVIQSNASSDAFAHFMEILDSLEPRCSPQISDDPLIH